MYDGLTELCGGLDLRFDTIEEFNVDRKAECISLIQ